MKVWEQILRRGDAMRGDPMIGVQDWINMFSLDGPGGQLLPTTMGSIGDEELTRSLSEAYRSNGPVFALTLARLQVFSQARFQWTRFTSGTPQDLFGTPELKILERPWPGGTTADLLARMEVFNSAAGNAFVRRLKRGAPGTAAHVDRLQCLRPEWTTIVLGSNEDADHPADAGDVELIGYAYKPGGRIDQMIALEPFEVAHYAPIPDPENNFVGMSWITPVLGEVLADDASEIHKRRFFQNAAPQPLDAKVLTPTGWTTMGQVQVGDDVVGVDGKPHPVVGVYPQGEQDIFRVHFTDGSSTECTADHVWRVASHYDRRKGTHRVLSLQELMDGGLRYPSGPAKWSVPLVDPVQFDDTHTALPVDPYLLGLLLGDGSFRGNGNGSGGVTLACAIHDADETEARITTRLPAEVTISRRDRGGWAEFYFRGRGAPVANPLTGAIRDLGLFDVPGHEKSIPDTYLLSDVGDRVALLQGLIDSDGGVDRQGAVRFTSTSRALVDGLVELVGGLGGTTSVAAVDRGHRPQWTVVVKRLPEWITPCTLARKTSRYAPIARGGRYRYIARVEAAGRKPAQCIRVDSDDHLYVTDEYVVTHNTPNLAIKFDASKTIEEVKAFKALLENEHRGKWNAYKTMYLGGGADAVAIGKDFQQLDFAATQGKGESRLASAAGVPPSWVGFSEGLQGSALNAGNFTAARRRFGDGTMHHLWGNAASSLEVLLTRPTGAQLWHDTRSIPFLREDAKEHAETQSKQAQTIRQLIEAGFEPASAVKAVTESDYSVLKHTGLVSVQLQKPGQPGTTPPIGAGS